MVFEPCERVVRHKGVATPYLVSLYQTEILRGEVTALLCKHLDCTYSIKLNTSISVDLFLRIQSPPVHHGVTLSQSLVNPLTLAKDKRLLVPHLNQQDTKYQLLCNGLLSFFPSHSSKFFHRLHTDSTQENEALISKKKKVSSG